jgi:hypothetical protein
MSAAHSAESVKFPRSIGGPGPRGGAGQGGGVRGARLGNAHRRGQFRGFRVVVYRQLRTLHGRAAMRGGLHRRLAHLRKPIGVIHATVQGTEPGELELGAGRSAGWRRHSPSFRTRTVVDHLHPSSFGAMQNDQPLGLMANCHRWPRAQVFRGTGDKACGGCDRSRSDTSTGRNIHTILFSGGKSLGT